MLSNGSLTLGLRGITWDVRFKCRFLGCAPSDANSVVTTEVTQELSTEGHGLPLSLDMCWLNLSMEMWSKFLILSAQMHVRKQLRIFLF